MPRCRAGSSRPRVFLGTQAGLCGALNAGLFGKPSLQILQEIENPAALNEPRSASGSPHLWFCAVPTGFVWLTVVRLLG
jgi:hypothetical protein